VETKLESRQRTTDGLAELLNDALVAQDLDALVVASPENVLYLSGARIFTQRLIPDRLACVVWLRRGRPTIVVGDIEEEFAREHSRIPTVAIYREHAESPVVGIARCLREAGCESGRIGVELDYLVARYWEELKAALPHATFATDDGLLASLRRVKTTDELELLERGGIALDRAIADGFAAGHEGATEQELGARIRESALGHGLEEVRWLFLSSAEHAHLVHRLPTDRPLRRGDLLRCDVGGVLGGYNVDLARTATIAPGSAEQRDVYSRVWQVHERAIARLEPGRKAREVYVETVADMERLGIPCRDPHIGHSIGLSIHEPPILSPDDESELEPGMVFCVEPAFYRKPDLFHVEDMVVVTERGPRVLTRSRDWSRLPELEVAEGGTRENR
jgi:Xaa-Pro aminopeptidase